MHVFICRLLGDVNEPVDKVIMVLSSMISEQKGTLDLGWLEINRFKESAAQ